MMRAESDEFLHTVLLYCWIGLMALSSSYFFQVLSAGVVQLP